MLRFLFRRMVLALLVCLTVLVVSFALTRLSGDLAISIAGPNATAQDITIIRKNYGLDRPLPLQFIDWAVHAAEGDLGRSYLYHAPVAGLIRERLPITLTLGLTGLVIALSVSIPLGVIAAMREGSAIDKAIGLLALFGQAMPSFWLSLVLIIWLGLRLQLLPISGVDTWDGYIMPGIVLAFSAIPALMRLTRAGMIDALSSDYIRTARAKGLIEKIVINRHALKNALLPVVTVIGIEFAFLIGGLVVTEQVFNLNGIGRLFVQAVQNQDYTLTQALVMLTVAIFVFSNLIVDLMYAWLDPRIRFA
jgi:ABC-type dipeptide/oligopeptide/nickel transport system permease component